MRIIGFLAGLVVVAIGVAFLVLEDDATAGVAGIVIGGLVVLFTVLARLAKRRGGEVSENYYADEDHYVGFDDDNDN